MIQKDLELLITPCGEAGRIVNDCVSIRGEKERILLFVLHRVENGYKVPLKDNIIPTILAAVHQVSRDFNSAGVNVDVRYKGLLVYPSKSYEGINFGYSQENRIHTQKDLELFIESQSPQLVHGESELYARTFGKN